MKATEKIRNNLENLVEQYNIALAKKDQDKLIELSDAITNALKVFAKESEDEFLAKCKAEGGDVVLNGIRNYDYVILKVRDIKKEGVVLAISLEEDLKQIDLLKLCKFAEHDTLWDYDVERMGEMLCLRLAKDLGVSPDDLKTIAKTYRMRELCERVKEGEVPDSNTKMVKVIQKVVDGIIYEDNGSGTNKYKVNNHDLVYLNACYGRRGRKGLSVTVATNRFLNVLMLDILHRIACDLMYSVNYKTMKEGENKRNAFAKKPAAAKKPEPAKVEAPTEAEIA